jgi:hypothetical protein
MVMRRAGLDGWLFSFFISCACQHFIMDARIDQQADIHDLFELGEEREVFIDLSGKRKPPTKGW